MESNIMIKNLRKLSDNENSFKAKLEKLDAILCIPTTGQKAIFYSTTEAGLYGIKTSLINKIENVGNMYLIHTLNSIYEFELV